MVSPFRAEETGRILFPASFPSENRISMISSNLLNAESHLQTLGTVLLKCVILPVVSQTTMASAACSIIDRARRSAATISSFFFCSVRSVTTRHHALGDPSDCNELIDRYTGTDVPP